MTTLRLVPSVGFLFAVGLLQSSRGDAQVPGQVSGSSDWPSYNRTLAGERYSPLATINRTNVARLKQVCSFVLPEVSSLQTGPLVVAGTMYFTTDTISY